MRVGRFDSLPADIEIDLTNIIINEVNLLRELEVLKGDLESRYDFTVYSAFRTIDRFNEGFLTIDNLKVFFRSNYQYFTDREILSVIRRIDTDGDARISYTEFSDYLRCQLPQNRFVEAENDLKYRSMSALKNSRLNVSGANASPLRRSSPPRALSSMRPTRSTHFNYNVTPEKKFSPYESRLGMSGFKTAEKSPTSSFVGSPNRSAYKSPQKQEVETETVLALREQISLERELENAKQNLAKQPDFNLFDAFRVFDTPSMGYVTLSELKLKLADIGVFATYDEIDLFFKRYNKGRDGRLRYSEFCDSVVPVDSYYASMLNRRGASSLRSSMYPRDECFSYSTRLDYKELWRTHLRVETSAEHLRQKLQHNPFFSTYDAFKTCDINEDGVVTQHELRRLME